ncbi:MAG: hypothetical protein A2145_01240 [candidate division Zixibacteria bacterium RBG_16_40_9]|nr:MAG: hypothetical protein A2145_01240 [candidate division Zixibacteria bacterium RBG_16_40_9]
MKECKKYQELLSEYLTGELSSEFKEKLDQHLVTCPYCQAELQELKATFEILEQEKKSAPAITELDFLVKVRTKIDKKQTSSVSPVFQPKWLGFSLAGVLVILLAWSLFRVDISHLTKKGTADTKTPPYDYLGQTGQNETALSEYELSQLLTPETEESLDRLYLQVAEDYYQKEDLVTVLADFSQSDFKILENRIKNINLNIK